MVVLDLGKVASSPSSQESQMVADTGGRESLKYDIPGWVSGVGRSTVRTVTRMGETVVGPAKLATSELSTNLQLTCVFRLSN